MYYRINEVLDTARSHKQAVYKSTDMLVRESATFSESKNYDVFLSHSFKDAELVLGVKLLIERSGRSVYVDWIDDPTLDRSNVTKATAATLRHRMKSCNSLIFATSENSSASKWMPWELGYFDGHKPDKVSILPLVESYDSEWAGQEYLSLYPVVEKLKLNSEMVPFVYRDSQNLQLLSTFGNSTYTTYKMVG